MSDSLNALGRYVRARRGVVLPEEVGLVRQPGRRVTGLRRQEVAELAGISAEYYLRIEQGRIGRPSEQVLSALARALRLDDESIAHMHRLVAGRPPQQVAPDPAVAERIARTLSRWYRTPAYISDPQRDIVASNALAAALGHGGLAVGVNQVAALFNPRMKSTLVEWEAMTRSAVATLRRDAHPDAPRLAELVRELSADPDFVRIWARHDVSGPEDTTFHIAIEGFGEVAIDAHNFAVRSLPGYQLTVLSAAPGGMAETLFTGLAASGPLTAGPTAGVSASGADPA
ncbi:helix-turn-helix transcriptional regulator [Microbacterium sp. Au-Mic1]|uniref:helix-turn-helix transcriptional regulator n=1 Tax=Microbacterium sp. Au-Mic1 TaxID=2906457 RepID=UPI001E2E2333|nr:helix-turn-helix transcriptional regulator [Microbacterium sp. Au-Mic1]MCE4026018.1 helix-turn-helix transcriptional regulator [Microbacterium sp. Au-Mic1]